jgi:hypothetical protein
MLLILVNNFFVFHASGFDFYHLLRENIVLRDLSSSIAKLLETVIPQIDEGISNQIHSFDETKYSLYIKAYKLLDKTEVCFF